MSLSTIALLTLAACVVASASADQQFNCPNNGMPKLDESDKPVQCLPGQSSEIVCGWGYSCFFSGFNYQCCPTNDEEEADEHRIRNADCPEGSFTVLDHFGLPIDCSGRKQCTEKNMFCNKNSPTPVCCENIDTKKAIHIDTQLSDDIEEPSATPSSTATRKNEVEPTAVVEDYARTTTVVNHDMGINGECATNARLVLDADGKRPVPCDRHHKCPEKGLLCLRANNGKHFCCEVVAERAEKLHLLKSSGSPPNQLKYAPENTALLVEELKGQAQQHVGDASTSSDVADFANASLLEPPPENPKKSYADNESKAMSPSSAPPGQRPLSDAVLRYVKTGKAEAHAVKSIAGQETLDVEESSRRLAEPSSAKVEYKPHSQGGYAVLEKLDKQGGQREEEERKRFAQRYLLEQIKNGWPYDDKFYRTEDVVVMRKGEHPAAIVHFPN